MERTKNKFLILGVGQLLALIIQFPNIAFAGGETSGGGNAVVCRDSDKKIVSAELLDLYEGRILYGRNFQKSNEEPSLQAKRLASNFINAQVEGWSNIAYNLIKDIDHSASIIQLLPAGTGLAPINDSFPEILPKDCKVEQLAAYLSTDKLLIDSEIWSSMDETNKAALLLHESIYKNMRNDFNAKDSKRSRIAVAHIVSNFNFVPIMNQIDANKHLLCFDKESNVYNNNVSFYIDLNNDNALISFITLAGQPVFSQRLTKVPKDFFLNPKWIMPGLSVTQSNLEGTDEIVFARSAGVLTIYVQKAFSDTSIRTPQYEFKCYKKCESLPGYCENQ